jgi:hypothetical protein
VRSLRGSALSLDFFFEAHGVTCDRRCRPR